MNANIHTLLTQEGPNAPSYHPDLAALDAQRTRITPAVGRESPQRFPCRPAAALAARWNRTATEFPGDHTGYWSHPDEFADALVDALAR
jgi:hypothetical protein